MREPRILIDQPLSTGAAITLDEGRSRYVGAVLRLGAGDRVRVFNARDGEWRAEIAGNAKSGTVVRVKDFLRAARATPDLHLLFAPVKRHATDLIVEKATELGVSSIRPVLTQRTIAETVRLERLATIAREAAEQTERFDVPEIHQPLALPRTLDDWDRSRPLIYADERGDDDGAAWGRDRGRAAPIVGALANVRADKLALLIGPEGGFTSHERELLCSHAFVISVSLGARILRAETAVMAGLAVIQSSWGDWR